MEKTETEKILDNQYNRRSRGICKSSNSEANIK